MLGLAPSAGSVDQLVVERLGDIVAPAAFSRQLFVIENLYLAVGAGNQPQRLQAAQMLGGRRAVNPQQVSKVLIGHLKLGAVAVASFPNEKLLTHALQYGVRQSTRSPLSHAGHPVEHISVAQLFCSRAFLQQLGEGFWIHLQHLARLPYDAATVH